MAQFLPQPRRLPAAGQLTSGRGRAERPAVTHKSVAGGRPTRAVHGPCRRRRYSARLCHLANLSFRLGSEVPFRQRPEAFKDEKAADEAFEGIKEHLSQSARLRLESATYRLGRKLKFDAAADRFVGDEEANGLLTRSYRAPFVVPEQV